MSLLSPTPAALQPVDFESETALIMAEAANVFLASLRPDQKAMAAKSLDDPGRLQWDYRPHPDRQGLSVKDMNSSQQKLALALLGSGLSRRGLTKALGIMALETILKDLEGPASRFIRDPDHYFVTVFGEVEKASTWGWRVEGHHLSLNFLVTADTRVSCLPHFMGANPARVPAGPLVGFAVLAPEEELARRLLLSLDPNQRRLALMSAEAPDDILTQNLPRVHPDKPAGLSFPEMYVPQQQQLDHLMQEYAGRLPQDVAEERLTQLEKDGKKYLHFAWAGSDEPGQPHYYRLQGPSLLIEYDNTQNQANHIHTVWRDFRNDWAEDWLRHHMTADHKQD
jgi:Protein of unknown function (DUF3500)